MTNSITGTLQKLNYRLAKPLEYFLSIGNESIFLNPYLGKKITLAFQGQVFCMHCGRATKKSFNQGYCFPCSQTLARCDICIVRPEKCHFHLGTCREPIYATSHCFIPHIIYIANTSGLKVGITRETQIPTRWVDQGATEALPLYKVQNRYHAGLVEVQLKQWMNDKTDWRKMLRGETEAIDLLAKRDELLMKSELLEFINHSKYDKIDPADVNVNADVRANEYLVIETIQKPSLSILEYPVLQYPTKVTSCNFEKTPIITGCLLGIKGQYLILDVGVINLRNWASHVFSIELS